MFFTIWWFMLNILCVSTIWWFYYTVVRPVSPKIFVKLFFHQEAVAGSLDFFSLFHFRKYINFSRNAFDLAIFNYTSGGKLTFDLIFLCIDSYKDKTEYPYRISLRSFFCRLVLSCLKFFPLY